MNTISQLQVEIETKTAFRAQNNAASIIAVLVAYSASLLVVGSALIVQYGFPLDDSYIHQTVARNLSRYHVLGFIPGVPSSGSTSLLWTVIQAANYTLFHVEPVAFNLLLGWGLLCFIGWLLFNLASRDGLPRSYSLAFAIAPALCGNFIWLALIGMEHLLFVAIALSCIWFWCDGRAVRTLFLVGTCLGLLSVTRPEAMVFGPILGMIALRKRYTAKECSLLLAPWAALTTALLAANLYTSCSLMPVTLKGRMWLYFHSTNPHSAQAIVLFILRWLVRLQTAVGLLLGPELVLIGVLFITSLCITGALTLSGLHAKRIRYIFLFALVHSGVFICKFPISGHGARYQPLNLMLILPCLFFGALFIFERMKFKNKSTAAILAVALLVAAGMRSMSIWQTASIDSIGHINNTHARVSQWLVVNTPENATVAAFDIGRISYDSGRRVIDLGGLTDPSYLPYMESGRVPAYLAKRNVDYVVLPSGLFARDLGFSAISPEIQFKRLTGFCSLRETWRFGAIYTGNASPCQDIYRVMK